MGKMSHIWVTAAPETGDVDLDPDWSEIITGAAASELRHIFSLFAAILVLRSTSNIFLLL